MEKNLLVYMNRSLDSRKPRFLQIVANNGMKISIAVLKHKAKRGNQFCMSMIGGSGILQCSRLEVQLKPEG